MHARTGGPAIRWKFLVAFCVAALAVAACGDDADTSTGDGATTTEAAGDDGSDDAAGSEDDAGAEDDAGSDDDVYDDGTSDDDADDEAAGGSDINAETQAALDEARATWASQGGDHVWEYIEDSEGVRTAFCYDSADADGCPLAGTEPGESVDSYLDRIQEMLDFAAETPGREVYAEFDPTTGHPVQVEAFGGEVDGLLMLTERFEA